MKRGHWVALLGILTFFGSFLGAAYLSGRPLLKVDESKLQTLEESPANLVPLPEAERSQLLPETGASSMQTLAEDNKALRNVVREKNEEINSLKAKIENLLELKKESRIKDATSQDGIKDF